MEQTAIDVTDESATSPKKDESVRMDAKQRPSTNLLAEAKPQATEETVYDCGEVMPQYPGGERALMEFIKTNLKYPTWRWNTVREVVSS